MTIDIVGILLSIVDAIFKIIFSRQFYVPVICLIAALVSTKSAGKAVEKLLLKKDLKSIDQKRKATIVNLVRNIVKYVIWGFCIMIALSAWGFDVTGVITGLGVVGVVAGLALQDALKDIIAGCNIILDNFFVLGDLICINGFTGTVIEFTLKNTKVRNADGEVLVIANREISSVKNLSIKFSSVAVVIPTAYEEKSKKVNAALEDICKEIDKWDITNKETELLGVDALNASSVDYLIRAYCKPGDQFELKRKILAYVKDTFDDKNIKIPYNQLEVHNEQ